MATDEVRHLHAGRPRGACDVVPTDEEGVQLLGTMVAYAGTFSLGENVVVHHIDTSWNQAWTGTNQMGRDLKSIGFDMQATFLRKLGSKCWPTDPVLAANVG